MKSFSVKHLFLYCSKQNCLL